MEPDSVQRFLDENFAPWVRALRPEVSAVSATGVTLDIPVTDDIARTGGIVSGQAMATLADTAMVLACGAQRGEMVPVATVTLDTQFLRPGTGDTLRAEAEIVRAGRALIFARCTLTTLPGGKPVAVATATFATV
ncbi:MAG: PaaI family thioesterase [Pseudomonadota bacterium]